MANDVMHKLIDGLAADPELAIFELGRRAGTLIETTSTDDDVIIYNVLVSFVKKFSLPIDTKSDLSYTDASKLIIRRIETFEFSLREKRVQLEVEQALEQYEVTNSKETFGYSKLNEDEKKKIHERLAKIRQLVGESSLSERKKNALFTRIAALAKEVDMHGTSTDRFFSFAGDVAFVLGDMTNKAKPLIHEVKEVLKIVSRSRAREERVSLPPGDEALSLPPPENSEEQEQDQSDAN